MGYCAIKSKMCDLVTSGGYCSVTTCINHDIAAPSNNMIYIPIEWLKTKTIEELYERLKDWEEENENG